MFEAKSLVFETSKKNLTNCNDFENSKRRQNELVASATHMSSHPKGLRLKAFAL
jgi:hypothetical protein